VQVFELLEEVVIEAERHALNHRCSLSRWLRCQRANRRKGESLLFSPLLPFSCFPSRVAVVD
jgi:hypothetical protein